MTAQKKIVSVAPESENDVILKAIKSAKIVHRTDPGHGWISVPISLLQLLGIEDQITAYSYIRGDRAYLEEDADGSTLILAIRKYIPGYVAKTTYVEKSPIRNYGSYSSEMAAICALPPEEVVGKRFIQGDSFYDVVDFRNDQFFVTKNGGEQKYRVKKHDLALHFVTQEMRDKAQEIRLAGEQMAERLSTHTRAHFYTKDNLSLPVKTVDDYKEFVDVFLDYTIKNKTQGLLRVGALGINRTISHEKFYELVEKIKVGTFSKEELRTIISEF